MLSHIQGPYRRAWLALERSVFGRFAEVASAEGGCGCPGVTPFRGRHHLFAALLFLPPCCAGVIATRAGLGLPSFAGQQGQVFLPSERPKVSLLGRGCLGST